MCMSNRRLRILALVAYNSLNGAIRTHQRFEQIETKEFRTAALDACLSSFLRRHHLIPPGLPFPTPASGREPLYAGSSRGLDVSAKGVKTMATEPRIVKFFETTLRDGE